MQSLNQSAIKTQARIAEPGCRAWQRAQGLQRDGPARDTFYRYQAAVQEGGVEALLEQTRHKPLRPSHRLGSSAWTWPMARSKLLIRAIWARRS